MKREKVDNLATYISEQVDKLTEATNPRERVQSAKHIAEQASLLEFYAVHEARAQDMSWGAIGEVFGYTRQGAQQRFGGGN
jgi:hypothetical protein